MLAIGFLPGFVLKEENEGFFPPVIRRSLFDCRRGGSHL